MSIRRTWQAVKGEGGLMVAQGEADDVGVGEKWRELHAEQLRLRSEIAEAEDPLEREALVKRLSSNRDTILRMERMNEGRPKDLSDAPAETSNGSSAGAHDGPPSDEDDEIDQLLASLLGDDDARKLAKTVERPATRTEDSDTKEGWWRNLRVSSMAVGAVAAALIVGAATLLWPSGDEPDVNRTAAGGQLADEADPATDEPSDADSLADLAAEAEKLDEALVGLGLGQVTTELRGDVIYVAGTVADEVELQAVLDAAESLADDVSVDTSGVVVEASPAPGDDAAAGPPTVNETTVQRELDRLLAATPLVFGRGERELTELQIRILNNVVALLTSYPDVDVEVVGLADDVGTDEENLEVSRARAEAVTGYLVGQGIQADRLTVVALGEVDATGSESLAGLERRVEIRAVQSSGPAAAPATTLRVGVVAPSAVNDLAFSQSIADAVAAVQAERGGLEVEIVANTFVPADAAAALRGFAEQGFELIVAHGSEYGSVVPAIAADYPDVTIAWGTTDADLGLDNVYTYDVASEQGGYVLGALAVSLSSTGIVGAVGPIEVGDASRFVEGFRAGAKTERPASAVRVDYTGSFSDTSLAAEVARAQIESGADVLTGTGEMVVGAIAVAVENDVYWFGNQADQSALAPHLVVASQVYHLEVVLRPVIADIEQGIRNGRALTADLANGGLTIGYNPNNEVPVETRQQMDELIASIIDGSLIVQP